MLPSPTVSSRAGNRQRSRHRVGHCPLPAEKDSTLSFTSTTNNRPIHFPAFANLFASMMAGARST
jgi:hypothetical protein